MLTNPQIPAAETTAEDPEARDERITELVYDQLDLEPGTLGEQDLFAEHGADSLGLLGVLAALEKEFRVTIEPDEFERMDCLAGVREVLAELAGW